MKGAIIVFEGTDSSGKATQAKLFFEKLKQKGFDSEYYSFPRYKEFFGSLVGKHLMGEFGNVTDLPPEFCALLFSIDKYQLKNEIEQKLALGKILVMNRYVQSNIAHQTAKFSSAKECESFFEWIECLESRMPKPSAVVFLDMPVEASQKLMSGADRKEDYRNGGEKDQHESDAAYLERTRKAYAMLAKKYSWLVINCAVQKSGEWKIRQREEIHEEIWEKLFPLIKKSKV